MRESRTYGSVRGRSAMIVPTASIRPCLLRVIFDASSTRKPLPRLPRKPTFACTATSDAVAICGHAGETINLAAWSDRRPVYLAFYLALACAIWPTSLAQSISIAP